MLSVARVLDGVSGVLLYSVVVLTAAAFSIKGTTLLAHAGMAALTFDQAAQESSRVNIGVTAQERARLYRPPELIIERPSAPNLPLGLLAHQMDVAEEQELTHRTRVAGWVKRARKPPPVDETVTNLILRSIAEL